MRLWEALFLAGLLAASVTPSAPIAAAENAEPRAWDSSTILSGFPRDLELDPLRGRLYVSDAPITGDQGVSIVNLSTQAVDARITIPEPTGLAVSPSGSVLAVGSRNARVYFVDPESLRITGSAALSDTDPWYSMSAWDVAFDGEHLVYVSPGQPFGLSGGFFPIWVVNVTTRQEVTRLEGFRGGSLVRVDAPNRLLYVGSSRYIPDEIQMWNLSTSPATRLVVRTEVGASSLVFSHDGSRLYLASGEVRDPFTLDLIGQAPVTGLVALSYTAEHAFYAYIERIARVNASLAERGVWRFEPGSIAWGPDPLTHLVAAPAGDALYVIVDEGVDRRRLDRVSLTSQITGMTPGEGEVVDENRWGLGFVVNGDVEWDGVQCWIDDALIPITHEPYGRENFRYMGSNPFPGGPHTIRVQAPERSGGMLSRTWSFTVDAFAPEIHLLYENISRDPSVSIAGVVVDDSPVTVRSWQGSLELAQDNRSFTLQAGLRLGANAVGVDATDTFGHFNSTFALVLFVPPTVLHSDRSGYSMERPLDWVHEEQTVEGRRIVIFRDPLGEANFNVIESGPLPGYAQEDILGIASEVWGEVLRTRVPDDAPSYLVINDMPAATWSYYWREPDVYQRQYLVGSPWRRMSWIVTFTAAPSEFEDPSGRMDPLFDWLMETMESPLPESPDALAGVIVPLGLSIAVALPSIMAVWWIVRRRRGSKRSGDVARRPEMPR